MSRIIEDTFSQLISESARQANAGKSRPATAASLQPTTSAPGLNAVNTITLNTTDGKQWFVAESDGLDSDNLIF